MRLRILLASVSSAVLLVVTPPSALGAGIAAQNAPTVQLPPVTETLANELRPQLPYAVQAALAQELIVQCRAEIAANYDPALGRRTREDLDGFISAGASIKSKMQRSEVERDLAYLQALRRLDVSDVMNRCELQVRLRQIDRGNSVPAGVVAAGATPTASARSAASPAPANAPVASAGMQDSDTAPDSPERRDMCRGLAQARSIPESGKSDFVNDCAAMTKLVLPVTAIGITRLQGFLDEKCISSRVIKTVRPARDYFILVSTIEIRNGCGMPMLYVIFGTKSAADILSQLHLGSDSQRAFWPQYNDRPTLTFTPLRDREAWLADVIAKDGAFTFDVWHEPSPPWTVQLKIAACPFVTNGVNQVVIRDALFTNFLCYPVPPAKRNPTQDKFLGTLAGQGSGKPAPKPAPKAP